MVQYTRNLGYSTNAIRVTASTYNATDIYAVRILTLGTGSLTLSPKGGGPDIVITATELTAAGINAFQDISLYCDSITVGAGMSVIAYI